MTNPLELEAFSATRFPGRPSAEAALDLDAFVRDAIVPVT